MGRRKHNKNGRQQLLRTWCDPYNVCFSGMHNARVNKIMGASTKIFERKLESFKRNGIIFIFGEPLRGQDVNVKFVL